MWLSWSTEICFCGVDEGVLGLSVSYYILCGFYAIFEFGGWHSNNQNANGCSDLIKLWHSDDAATFFQYNSFIFVVMMNKFILVTLVSFEVFLYGIYVELFPFITVFIMVIIAYILSFYYLRLPDQHSTDEVKLIVVVFFDINIGNIILSYLQISSKNHLDVEMQRIRH